VRAKRVDANQVQIVKALREKGYTVQVVSDCSSLGFDLIASKGYGETVLFIEVKDGSKPPSARALTTNEERAKRLYPRNWVQVESIDALELLP